jgi:hypothetical protein
MSLRRLFYFLALGLLVFCCAPANPQTVAQPESLFKTIQKLDTKLFDAYNHCDLGTLGAMVSDDLVLSRPDWVVGGERNISRSN